MTKKIVAVSLLTALFAGAATVAKKGSGPKAHDGKPWTVDIEELTLKNGDFRSAEWTGKSIQLTVMSIEPGGEIGMEKHDEGDQFLRVEKGKARVVMGKERERLDFDREVSDDWAILIPAGIWHNVTNTGDTELKVYALYAPPEHPAGTRHKTAEQAQADHPR